MIEASLKRPPALQITKSPVFAGGKPIFLSFVEQPEHELS